MVHLRRDDPVIADLVRSEEARIENTINLIAAENHAPLSVMEVMGSIFNTKTIEGYPGNRFHAGCEHVDAVERLAVQRARQLFGAEYANVQPHSGTSANLASQRGLRETDWPERFFSSCSTRMRETAVNPAKKNSKINGVIFQPSPT